MWRITVKPIFGEGVLPTVVHAVVRRMLPGAAAWLGGSLGEDQVRGSFVEVGQTVRPRVLMVTTQLGYGGSESAFLRLAQYLSCYLPVTIALFAWDYGGNYRVAEISTDLPVVLLDDPAASRRHRLKVVRWWHMLRRLHVLKRQHDVTISFLSGPNLLNALAGHQFGSIVSERGSKLYHVGLPIWTKLLWLRILDPLIYRLVDRIVPASHAYAAEIVQIAGSEQAWKVVSIEGGIDAAALIAATSASVEAEMMAFCAAPTVVVCGRLDRGKGIDFLIPIFSQVKRRVPGARLLVIGDGPLLERLIASSKAEGLRVTPSAHLEGDVFFAGYRPEPMRYFRLCRVFAFPSQHEGLGNALVEAVASGVPILAADCNFGPRSILADSAERVRSNDLQSLPLQLAYGTLMPQIDAPGSAEVWEWHLVRALTAPPRRATPDRCAAAVARFDIARTGPEWLRLIKAVSDAHHQGGAGAP